MSGKCIHSRSTAWISYVVLIALLLPAISMTDDLMAMVTPADGEQVARRYYEVSPAGSHQAKLHVAILRTTWDTFHTPLVVIGNLEIIPVFDAFCPPSLRHAQGRAPPAAV